MQKMTLLEMTQNILSAMNSDEVNSISDTVESLQVAEEIRTTFYELYGNRDIASFEGLITLESPGNSDTPHILTLPSNVSHVKWIKYRNHRNGNHLSYNDVQYLEPEEFIKRFIEATENLHSSYVPVNLLSLSPVQFPIADNKAPDYFTIFANSQEIVFDSFDASEESHLTGSNSLAWGTLFKEFDLEDDFIPPVDANLFPHFLAEARSACFINIKEVANSKEEQRARRQLVRSQVRTTNIPGQRRSAFSGVNYARHR